MIGGTLRRLGRAAPAQRLAVIDAPGPAAVVDRFAFPVRGWVWAGADQPRIAAVEIWRGDILLGETRDLLDRPDVRAHLELPEPVRTGFHAIACDPSSARGSLLDVAVRLRFVDGTRSDALAGARVQTLGSPGDGLVGLRGDDEVRAAVSRTAELPWPPPDLQSRQIGGVWNEIFYREGRVMLTQIAAAFERAGKPLEAAGSILDFGCGCGRVLGAFVDLPRAGDLWGCDIDAEAIAWNGENLGSIARFAVNPAMPPAPFATGQFDAIYSVSVFTHLPEDMQFAWLTELRRLLRPGGVAVVSVHGGRYYAEAAADVRAEVAEHGFAYRTGAVTPGLPDFYMVAMHAESYIRAKWGRFFEVLDVHERLIHGAHDAVVLRRTAD